MRSVGLLCVAILASSQPLFAQPLNERQREYLSFIKAQATQLRAADKPPALGKSLVILRKDDSQKQSVCQTPCFRGLSAATLYRVTPRIGWAMYATYARRRVMPLGAVGDGELLVDRGREVLGDLRGVDQHWW